MLGRLASVPLRRRVFASGSSAHQPASLGGLRCAAAAGCRCYHDRSTSGSAGARGPRRKFGGQQKKAQTGYQKTRPSTRETVPLEAAVAKLEGWAAAAPAGCSTTSGKVARALSNVRAGDRTAYLQRATALGHANAGVALEYLRLVFTDEECEWDRGAAEAWASGVVNDLGAAGLEMRIQPLIWVLTHCSKAGADAGRACVVLSLAQAGGVAVDVHLYSALVNVAAKQHRGANFVLALRLVEIMREQGVAPNEVTYNSLIDALGRERDPHTSKTVLQTCNALLERMVELDDIQPSARTLTGLTFAIGRAEGGADIQPAFATLDFLRQRNTQSDRVFYTSLLHACAVARGGADVDSAHSILYMLQADGLVPDMHTYNELLSACALAKGGGQPGQAEAVMTRVVNDELSPTVRSYNWLLEAYARQPKGEGSADSAMDVLLRMQSAGVQPTEKTFELLLAAVLRSARPASEDSGRTYIGENGTGTEGGGMLGWLSGIVKGRPGDRTDELAVVTPDESVVLTQWRDVLEAMETSRADRPFRHTGAATRALLGIMAEQGDAEHVVPVLNEMAIKRGSGGVLGGKLGPSAVAAALEACARAAADRRQLHPSVHAWSQPSSSRGGKAAGRAAYDSMRTGAEGYSRGNQPAAHLANHAQLAIQVAEGAAVYRHYGGAASRLSPQALEWLVAACLHDTAAAAQKAASDKESSALGLQHMQYATLSRGMALLENLQRRLPKQWKTHLEDAPIEPSDSRTNTIGPGGSYAERLRWAVQTLRLLNSLCGASTSGRALSSMLQDDDEDDGTNDLDSVRGDGSASSSDLLAALIRSCTQSELSADGDVAVDMGAAAYAAAVAVNTDSARASDVFTAMIEAWAHTKHAETRSKWTPAKQTQRAEEAFRVLDTMRSMGVEPDQSTFNALMSVCAVYTDPNLALSTFDMMKYHRIEPDHTTFTHLIGSCGTDAKMARQVFDDYFLKSGLPPAVSVFEALVQACAAAGDLESAAATLQELEEQPGMMPTDACHDAMLHAAAATIRATSTAALLPADDSADGSSVQMHDRAVGVAVETLQCMHDEGRRPGALAVLSLLYALEGTPLVAESSDKAGQQRRSVLEAVQSWVTVTVDPTHQLRWNGRTPTQRREQQREFQLVCNRLWHPL